MRRGADDMPKALVLLTIGLIFGIGLGFLAGAVTGPGTAPVTYATPGDQTAAVHDHTAHDHGGGPMTLTDVTGAIPTVSLTLHPDGPQSRNLEIKVTNFTFNPQDVNGANTPGHGHAHIYINDIKIARTYAPWFHLEALPKGTHRIRVTLNSNDHGQLAVEGKPIETTTTLFIE